MTKILISALVLGCLASSAAAQSAPGGFGDAREHMLPSTEGLSGTGGIIASDPSRVVPRYSGRSVAVRRPVVRRSTSPLN